MDLFFLTLIRHVLVTVQRAGSSGYVCLPGSLPFGARDPEILNVASKLFMYSLYEPSPRPLRFYSCRTGALGGLTRRTSMETRGLRVPQASEVQEVLADHGVTRGRGAHTVLTALLDRLETQGHLVEVREGLLGVSCLFV